VTPASVRSVAEAAAFVDRAGVVLVFPSDDTVLPSLWEEAIGTPEVEVFTVDPKTGRRVLTPELERVWAIKDRLARERRCCLGKHVRRRLALVSLRLVPALYALTGRAGRADDFRSPGLLSPLELELAESLYEEAPATSPELRERLGIGDAKGTKRALEALQHLLVVTHAGEVEQKQGWDAASFELVARRFPEELSTLPSLEDARVELAKAVLAVAPDASAAEVAKPFAVTKAEAQEALDRLAAD
jgi:hypothetical protein